MWKSHFWFTIAHCGTHHYFGQCVAHNWQLFLLCGTCTGMLTSSTSKVLFIPFCCILSPKAVFLMMKNYSLLFRIHHLLQKLQKNMLDNISCNCGNQLKTIWTKCSSPDTTSQLIKQIMRFFSVQAVWKHRSLQTQDSTNIQLHHLEHFFISIHI